MFLVIAQSHRSDSVPHWLCSDTLAGLNKPCPTAKISEGHIFDIGRSRQLLTETALKSSDVTHILFVDDDIAIPNRDCLLGMFQFLEEYDQHIVSGLYYEKFGFHERCPSCGRGINRPLIFGMEEREGKIYFRFGQKPPNANVIQVGCVPAGFLLVKREVFEKMLKPWFIYGAMELQKKQVVDTARPVGEDVYFSYKAKQAGFKLWVDTRADLLHFIQTWVGSEAALQFAYARDEGLGDRLDAIKTRYLTEPVKAPSGLDKKIVKEE